MQYKESFTSLYMRWLCLLLEAELCTYLTIPCSLFHYFPNLARCVVWFLLSMCPCCLLTTWKCVPLVDLFDSLLWAGKKWSVTDTFALGYSFHLLSSHCFLSTYNADMLKYKNPQQNKQTNKQTNKQKKHVNLLNICEGITPACIKGLTKQSWTCRYVVTTEHLWRDHTCLYQRPNKNNHELVDI